MNQSKSDEELAGARESKRYSPLSDLAIVYEGHSETIPVHGPDLTPLGMFINTPRRFPHGAILKVRFRLAITNVEVQARCEVRHCLAGIGIGVEFVDISPEAQLAIEQEIIMGKHS